MEVKFKTNGKIIYNKNMVKVKFLKNWRSAEEGSIMSIMEKNVKYLTERGIIEVVKAKKQTKEVKAIKTK